MIAGRKKARDCVLQTAVKTPTEMHISNMLYMCPKNTPENQIISAYPRRRRKKNRKNYKKKKKYKYSEEEIHILNVQMEYSVYMARIKC